MILWLWVAEEDLPKNKILARLLRTQYTTSKLTVIHEEGGYDILLNMNIGTANLSIHHVRYWLQFLEELITIPLNKVKVHGIDLLLEAQMRKYHRSMIRISSERYYIQSKKKDNKFSLHFEKLKCTKYHLTFKEEMPNGIIRARFSVDVRHTFRTEILASNLLRREFWKFIILQAKDLFDELNLEGVKGKRQFASKFQEQFRIQQEMLGLPN